MQLKTFGRLQAIKIMFFSFAFALSIEEKEERKTYIKNYVQS